MIQQTRQYFNVRKMYGRELPASLNGKKHEQWQSETFIALTDSEEMGMERIVVTGNREKSWADAEVLLSVSCPTLCCHQNSMMYTRGWGLGDVTYIASFSFGASSGDVNSRHGLQRPAGGGSRGDLFAGSCQRGASAGSTSVVPEAGGLVAADKLCDLRALEAGH